jgi:hypothetical protein
LALDVEGVLDVSGIAVTAHKSGLEAIRSEKENIEISDEEKALARNIGISFRKVRNFE